MSPWTMRAIIVGTIILIDVVSWLVVPCGVENGYQPNYEHESYYEYCSYHGGIIAAGFHLIVRFKPETWTALSTLAIAVEHGNHASDSIGDMMAADWS